MNHTKNLLMISGAALLMGTCVFMVTKKLNSSINELTMKSELSLLKAQALGYRTKVLLAGFDTRKAGNAFDIRVNQFLPFNNPKYIVGINPKCFPDDFVNMLDGDRFKEQLSEPDRFTVDLSQEHTQRIRAFYEKLPCPEDTQEFNAYGVLVYGKEKKNLAFFRSAPKSEASGLVDPETLELIEKAK